MTDGGKQCFGPCRVEVTRLADHRPEATRSCEGNAQQRPVVTAELVPAQHEMPGLMACRTDFGQQPFKGININGSFHITILPGGGNPPGSLQTCGNVV